jgi:hypothetical protein
LPAAADCRDAGFAAMVRKLVDSNRSVNMAKYFA